MSTENYSIVSITPSHGAGRIEKLVSTLSNPKIKWFVLISKLFELRKVLHRIYPKFKNNLGWVSDYDLQGLVEDMMKSDIEIIENESL